MTSNSFENACQLIKKLEGYEKQRQWLKKKNKNRAFDFYSTQIRNSTNKMKVICH